MESLEGFLFSQKFNHLANTMTLGNVSLSLWKFDNFSATQIFREINFLDLGVSKYPIFAIFSISTCKINFTQNVKGRKCLEFPHRVSYT